MPKKWLPRLKVLQTHLQLWPPGHHFATSTALDDLGWQGKTEPVLTWQLAWPMAVRVEGIMGKQYRSHGTGGTHRPREVLLGIHGALTDCMVAEVVDRGWGGSEWADFQTRVPSTVY